MSLNQVETVHFPAEAVEVVTRARALVQGWGNETIDAVHTLFAGIALHAAGETLPAFAELESAFETAERAGNYMCGGVALMNLAARSVGVYSSAESASLLSMAIERFRERHQPVFLDFSVTGAAAWLASNNDVAGTALVLGWLDRHLPSGWQTMADVRAKATAFLDTHPEAQPWRDQGAAMSHEQIVAYCLERLDEQS